MAVKEIVPVFYLFVWLVMYIIYQFKLTEPLLNTLANKAGLFLCRGL